MNALFAALAALLAAIPAFAIEVHGHRGSRGTHPENTLAGFEEALRAGADVIELDLGLTRDGVLVAAHDPHLLPERCLGPGGALLKEPLALRALTFKQLAAYDCGSLRDTRFPRQASVPFQAPPSLDQVFDLVAASTHPAAATVGFNIEAKTVPSRPELSAGPEEFARRLAEVLERRKMAGRAVVQSFDHRVLRELRLRLPAARLSALTAEDRPDYAALARGLGAEYVSPDQEWLSAADVRAAHDAGVKVAPWTANDEAQWARLAGMGVDAIITDYPAELRAWLDRRGTRAAPRPRLAVLISVDQLRGDFFRRFGARLTGGLARAAREGARFERARHGSVPTETSPGHAALATGCFPSQHGIVANSWWDRDARSSRYSVEDPELSRSPAALQCPTLGDALKSSLPGARVVSLAGKDRAAILMGGRSPDLALWYNKTTGHFVSSGYYGPAPDWVWDFGARLRIPKPERSSLTRTSRYDRLVLDLAERAVSEMSLGRGPAPDLLLLGLSATDLIGHAWGPDSPQMEAHLLALDRALGGFFDMLDRTLGREGWVLALSSDHGVAPIPETPAAAASGARRVGHSAFADELESALAARFGTRPGRPWVAGIYPPHVYVDGPLAAAEHARRFLMAHPAVAHVYLKSELMGNAGGGPFAEEFRRSAHTRSGDLLMLLKEGVLLEDGDRGTGHGLPYDDDARVPLLFAGPGVRPGVYEAPALATDLAPTLGRLLGVPFPPREPSRVLWEALGSAPGGPGLSAAPAIRPVGAALPN